MNAYAVAVFMLGGLSIPLDAQAIEQKLWKYPCDVIMSNVCFRLPSGMSVIYEVPADFGIYTVKDAQNELVTIYSGSAPNQSRFSSAPSIELKSRGHHLVGFVSKERGVESVDIFITPTKRRSNESVTHIHSELTAATNDAMAKIVSGIRPCVSETREKLVCPVESAWGQQLFQWVLMIGTQELHRTNGTEAINPRP